ncbi:MAG: succinate dehydrogenase, cytochrome b556 subunit [Candidatus Heimdallarchaeota archaeon]
MSSEQLAARQESRFENIWRWFIPRHRGIGMVAWILQRITGLLIVAYLFGHIVVLFSLTQGQDKYTESVEMISGGLWILFDAGLVLVLLYHALNGIRVLLFDLGFGTTKRAQKIVFWLLMGLGAILFIYFFYLLTQIELIHT